MIIVNGFELMKYAIKNGYVMPAFNTTNMEITYGIIEGINIARMPAYIQISSNNLRLSNPGIIAEMVRDALKKADTPISLHLDHGKSFEDVQECVKAGFTSVMIDASHLPYEENVRVVREVVDYCHYHGIPVEAELGAIRGKEEDIINEVDAKTDPELVRDFAVRTGCDLLAVSVGNVHGLNMKPEIDMPLLQRIYENSPCPLVMHGGSGIPFDVIRQARRYGLLKINYGSDLRKEFIRTFGEAYLNDRNAHDVISLSLRAVENVRNKVVELITEINRNTD